MRIAGDGIPLGVLIRNHALAAKIVKKAKAAGFNVSWAIRPEELTLAARYVVMSRGDGFPTEGRRVLYVEDYPSLECLLMQVVTEDRGRKGVWRLAISVDPGRSIGTAYIADGAVIATSTYVSKEALIEECRSVIECLGKGRAIEFYVGDSRNEYGDEIVRELEREIGKKSIMLVPEEGAGETSIGRGLPRDERSALLIYYRARQIR